MLWKMGIRFFKNYRFYVKPFGPIFHIRFDCSIKKIGTKNWFTTFSLWNNYIILLSNQIKYSKSLHFSSLIRISFSNRSTFWIKLFKNFSSILLELILHLTFEIPRQKLLALIWAGKIFHIKWDQKWSADIIKARSKLA